MILVTGGTGLSGSFVVQELHRRGYPVRVLARSPASDTSETPGIEYFQGDLADPESLRRACEGAMGIVHAACTFTDSNIDIAAMQALLEGWQTGPFVFFSSLDVYGLSAAPFITEEEPLDENYNDYARGKVVSERLLSETAQQQGRTDYTILRAPHIWAPHPKARRRLMDTLGKGPTIILPGATEEEWSQYRDAWIDARDLAWLVAESLQRPLGAVNVLSGHFTWHDLVTHLIQLTGSDRQIIHKPLADITEEELPNKRFYAQKWQYSDQQIRDVLGYRPTYSFQETVAEVIRDKKHQ